MLKYRIEIVVSLCVLFALGMGYSLYTKLSTSAPDNQIQNKTVENYDAASTTPVSETTATDDNSKTLTNNTKKEMEKKTATMHTNKGDIEIEFFDTLTPNTVANFVKLAKTGFYDGVKFHRVIKGFMIQGGDPLSKDDTQKSSWGTGGPGYKFDDELSPENSNVTGTIAMANSGPDTNGSQFFINVKDNNFLDTKHTVFGKVTKGMDVVTAIENTPVDGSDKPIDAIIIQSISF
ncbi:MAG: peptidyl-prolyl cis-trans isomerase, peptidylprolyl isomerase [Candidatus Taylorbacteria bacterium]|nr:peptidyl-prolyl cis-trans isomerase, peptidylprolyl isomerase [Candidatus Taylorbacteria bacterium]